MIYRLLFALAALSAGVEGTCVDLPNLSTGVSECPSLAYLCNNTIYYTLMTTQCPATCGRCTNSTTTTTTTTCVDQKNTATGVSDCPSRAYLCNNTVYYTLMTTQCPATCGRCNSTTTTTTTTNSTSCVDQTNPSTGVSDCSSRAYLCNNTLYYSFMTTQCPATCGRCTASTTNTTSTSTCADLPNPYTGVSDCPARRSLCSDSNYASLMAVQCRATCGLCSGKK